MKHSKLSLLGMLAAAAAVCSSTAWADTTTPGIVNSPHDFTVATNFWVAGVTNWIPNDNVCEECHTPHKASANYQAAGPLWAHPEGTAGVPTYVPYSSPQLIADGVSGKQPGYASLACLSCHDGNIAINQMSGSSSFTGGAAVNIPSFAQITTTNGAGNNLSGTHPIGIDYNIAQGNDSGLFPSSTAVANAGADTGKSIATLMLFNETTVGGTSAMLECASCHDIHQEKGVSGVASSGTLSHRDSVIIGTPTSTQSLCLTCHNK